MPCNHVFQGLDTLTPTLIIGDELKMVSITNVMFAFVNAYLPASGAVFYGSFKFILLPSIF